MNPVFNLPRDDARKKSAYILHNIVKSQIPKVYVDFPQALVESWRILKIVKFY